MATPILKNLFRSKQSTVTPPQPINYNGSDNIRADETYVSYGKRVCGIVTGSHNALSAFLPRVYNIEKQRQVSNQELQQKHKDHISKQIENLDNDISQLNAEKSKIDLKINELDESIKDNEEQLIEAKNLHGEINKKAKVKLYIGLVILAILTVYLFIFYSSTFYSAFFKNFDENIGIGDAMFDSQAIPHALSDGFGELMFILCAPVIFMGLGYGLHFFMQQTSRIKYVKTIGILLLTFTFDCILAYLIAQKIYNVQILMRLGEYPDFDMNMAIHDINVWAVIFCGFIVYIIWGIVFDMTLTAYDDLRSNKTEIDKCQERKQYLKKELFEEQGKRANIIADIEKRENQRNSYISELSKSVHFDIQIIKTALADFFSGWMTLMPALEQKKAEQDKATQIYQETISQLFN